MNPYYADDSVTLYAGDCLDVLAELPDDSVDAVVTDPPYGLEFMGKEWDSFAPRDRKNSTVWDGRRQAQDGWQEDAAARSGKGGGGPSYRSQHKGSKRCDLCGKRQFSGSPCVCPEPEWTVEHRQEAPSTMLAFQAWCTEWSRECYRVLKPGGHLLAFGGTRTWHRLACAVEDAGFEIRDSIAWLHGQGFPKSLNVSEALNGVRCTCPPVPYNHASDVPGVRDGLRATPESSSPSEVPDVFPEVQRGSARTGVGPVRSAGAEDARPLRAEVRSGQPCMEGRRDAQAPARELQGRQIRPLPTGVLGDGEGGRLHLGAPSSDGAMGGTDADPLGVREPQGPRPVEQRPGEPGALPDERRPQAWGGWPVCERCSQPVVPDGLGTAAKPGHEPIVVARKPLIGTVAANVQAWGTGALNIDGCRIGERVETWPISRGPNTRNSMAGGVMAQTETGSAPAGRWPANVTLDENQAAALDQQSGTLTSGLVQPHHADAGKDDGIYGAMPGGGGRSSFGDTGGASRFFYTAKADAGERIKLDGIAHPTVKPLSLMRWLVRLVCPPGGVVLEPFAGSGTTVEACILEGFRCIAIEREADYLPLITQRINRRRDPVAAVLAGGEDAGLFDLLGDLEVLEELGEETA